jgi:hypothetical protein
MSEHLPDATDDAIVDGLATFGHDGVPVTKLSQFATRMDLDNWNGLEERLYMLHLKTDRVVRPNGDDHYALSNAEWGRRLAGKFAEPIAEILDGEPWTWTTF